MSELAPRQLIGNIPFGELIGVRYKVPVIKSKRFKLPVPDKTEASSGEK